MFGRFSVPTLWFLFLLPFSLLIAKDWPWLWSPEGVTQGIPSPSSLLVTTPGLLLVGVGVVLVLVFAWRGQRRRAVVGTLIVSLIVLQLLDPFIGWDRIILLACGLAAVGLIVESVRQNAGLLREIYATDVRFSKRLLKTLFLWTPVAVIAYAGYHIDRRLDAVATQLVYDTTPVDEYCESSATARVFACSELAPNGSTVNVAHLTLDQDLSVHLQQQFLDEQESLIHELWIVRDLDAKFGDDAELRNLASTLASRISPRGVLGLAEIVANADERIGRDGELTRLKARLRATKPLVQFRVLNSRVSFANPEVDRIKKQIAAREAAVRSEVAADAPPDTPEAQFAQSVARQAAAIAPKLDFARVQLLPADALDERRALAIGLTIEQLQKMEVAVAGALIPYATGLNASEQAAFYSHLGIEHRCSVRRASSYVYTNEDFDEISEVNRAPFPCDPAQRYVGNYGRLPLEDSVDRSIDAAFHEQEEGLSLSTRSAFLTFFAAAGAGADAALEIANAVPTSISLGKEYCGDWEPYSYFNCLMNSLKRRAERAYIDQRKEMGARHLRRVQTIKGGADATSAQQLLQLHIASQSLLQEARQATRDAVQRGFAAVAVVSWILALLVVVALIKSSLYVAGLVFFDVNGPSVIRVADTRMPSGRIRVAAENATLKLGDIPLLTKAVLGNQEAHTVFCPKPFSAPLGRLLRFKYVTFNQGRLSRGVDPRSHISFSRGGKYVVDWELAAGDQVIFDYKHLFGFSDNIRLTSIVSLRISTLLFGRMVFHVAECESGTGHLLLTTNPLEGEWRKGTEDFIDNVDAVPPHRLVAWEANTRFRVENRLTIGAIVNDSFNIVRLRDGNRGRMLAEKPVGNAIPLAGTFRYFKRLLWPF
jgi:hypothetical protein